MSWIGKILAVMGMILALAVMWFAASAFAVRTNWKVQADNYKKGYEDAKIAREAEYRTYQSEKDALARQLKSEQTRAEGLSAQLEKAKTDITQNTTQLAKLTEAVNDLNIRASELQANAAAQQARADKLGTRVNSLEDEKIKLTIIAEQATKDKQAAETLTRQAQADKLNADKKVEELTNSLADAKAAGIGGGTGTGSASLFTPRPVPIREGTRGTVQVYRDGLLEITLGIDHGVTTGATLDVYRTGADAKYLGTVVIDRAYPQASVGTFRPADPRRGIRSLRPEELPKVGDRVGRVGSIAVTP
jgi:hypothetical protein